MATKNELLKKVLGEIKNKVADDIIVDFNDEKNRTFDTLCSWGSLLVDQVAPLVRGRIIEVYGPESSGKSSLSIAACANVINNGGIAVYIDAECAFNVGFAEAFGLNLQNPNFVLIQPGTEEDACATMIKLVNSGGVDLVVLDSTSALTPKCEILADNDDSNELSEQRIGIKAKILNNTITQLVFSANKTGTTCIFISQLRSNVSMFGSPDTIGVGKALGYYASIRMRVARTGKIEGDLSDGTKGIIAIPVQVSTTKNKIVAPFKKVDIQINVEGPNKGICIESEYTQVAFNLGIFIKDNRGIQFAEETPLYPKDTPLASSMPKLNEILGEVKNENHPYYWIKQEIELRVKEKLNLITSDEVENILGPIYITKEKENQLAQEYFNLANKASNSSDLVVANYYIEKAYNYNAFDKNIIAKYKTITKRYLEKQSSIKDFVCEISNLEEGITQKIDLSTGEIITKEVLKFDISDKEFISK